MRASNRIKHERLRKSITVIMVYDELPPPKKLLKEICNEAILKNMISLLSYFVHKYKVMLLPSEHKSQTIRNEEE